MSYYIGGSSGESSAFEKTIQNSAIQVLHESQGLVNMTNVVMPTQGNVYKVPHMAPLSYGDFDGQDGTQNYTGAYEQTATITSKEVTATPAVAQTAFSKFLGWTTAFDLANNLGSELGQSFAEKVDQRVAAAAASGFKQTQGATYYTQSSTATNVVDGFSRVQAIGQQGLCFADDNTHNNASNANTVTGMIRNVIKAWREARNPGRPTVVLSPTEEQALLGELTGGAVYSAQSGNSINAGLTALGDELLATGMLRNLYGCTVIFTTFLKSATRTVGRGSANVHVGFATGPQAMTTVMVRGLDISMGDKDGGLQTWITGLGYFGSGVTAQARGMEIAIVDSYI
jgi:gas vesicle protein